MISNHVWSARHAVRWRWRRRRGQTGDFPAPMTSERAADLSRRWDAIWTDDEPYAAVHSDRDRWVRFHSLPGSKQYADTDAEREEILRRHRTALSELQGSDDTRDLICILTDFEAPVFESGWARKQVPSAWPWRMIEQREDTWFACTVFLWAAGGLDAGQIDALLLKVADDEATAAFCDTTMSWLYRPYDGGADVLLASTTARDELKARHSDWLSDHPQDL